MVPPGLTYSYAYAEAHIQLEARVKGHARTLLTGMQDHSITDLKLGRPLRVEGGGGGHSCNHDQCTEHKLHEPSALDAFGLGSYS